MGFAISTMANEIVVMDEIMGLMVGSVAVIDVLKVDNELAYVVVVYSDTVIELCYAAIAMVPIVN